MADTDGGNNSEPDGGWYVVREAECEESDDEEDLEKLFDDSTDGDLSDLIDDGEVVEADCCHAELLNAQLAEDDRCRLSVLKRKYTTPSPKAPDVQDLSPSLQAVSISPRKKHSKRRLFDDSGIDSSHETSGVVASPAQVPETQNGCSQGDARGILNGSEQESSVMLQFKSEFGVSYKELCRVYKSNKTCCNDWVIVIFGSKEEILEASKSLLKNHADFFQMQCRESCLGWFCLLLIQFKFAKNRDTIRKTLSQLFCVPGNYIYAEPPKVRSVAVALYFYKSVSNRETFKHGDYPEWIDSQLQLSHQVGSETFELATMIQWAYDHGFQDEATIAYMYAKEADHDPNAAAWLKHNGQAKFVKDAAHMVRLYRRQEMRDMSMSQWLGHRARNEKQDGDWRDIAKFLKYQGVQFLDFLCILRQLLAGTPKKSCLMIHGPPDTGKSTFAYSLVTFCGGGVVSFVNSRSHFWLSPLVDCKIGLIDDVTHACLQYMDQYMRSSFDGNPVSLDCKHKIPVQTKMPPMLMTSNLDIFDNPLYFYLKSRIRGMYFPRPFPVNADGSPLFSLTPGSWKSFFDKLHVQLGLDPEDFQDGEPTHTLRCCARSAVPAL
ncbi:putative E1 protein [Canis familiaris papillomavirus 13]|uniref:Replication protein E1 n=1 Tax=Canis familiaris papillomavirus 13 TaxID=1226723 RepID=J7JEQ8_9PAPI|nr:putative E1 protein [Canis familiaris papillomavirus 13]AFQ52494.1 putative E1 protein [Canis familiaris papillomavirus 13]